VERVAGRLNVDTFYVLSSALIALVELIALITFVAYNRKSVRRERREMTNDPMTNDSIQAEVKVEAE
jgi:hypothetical protein